MSRCWQRHKMAFVDDVLQGPSACPYLTAMSQRPCESAQQRPRTERKRLRAFCSVMPFPSNPRAFAPLRRPSTAGSRCTLTDRTSFLPFPFPPPISRFAPSPPANSRFARCGKPLLRRGPCHVRSVTSARAHGTRIFNARPSVLGPTAAIPFVCQPGCTSGA